VNSNLCANQVWCVAWSPSGKTLASCGGDKTVRIWEERGGKWICEAILEDAHDRTIRALCWSPGGERLATTSFDGTCVIWTSRNGEYEQIATLQVPAPHQPSPPWRRPRGKS
jgi:WD40 repeat protein